MAAAPKKLLRTHDENSYSAWIRFEKFTAYWNGVDTIVPMAEYEPVYPRVKKPGEEGEKPRCWTGGGREFEVREVRSDEREGVDERLSDGL